MILFSQKTPGMSRSFERADKIMKGEYQLNAQLDSFPSGYETTLKTLF